MTEQKSMVDILAEHIRSGRTKLIPFNKAAASIQKEMASGDPNFDRIERLIVCDQALTGEVLKTANSPFYKGFENILTVKDAIVRLGSQAVADIVLIVTQKQNYASVAPKHLPYLNRLWKHSVASAVGTQWLVRKLGYGEFNDSAFSAGLLHDLGRLFLFTAMEEIKKENKKFNPSTAFSDKVIDTLHPKQGYQILKEWNLPEVFCIIARDHHQEEFDTANTLLTIVRLVDLTCNKLGLGLPRNDDLHPAESMESNLLGLSEIVLAELEIALEDAMAKFGV